MVSYGTGSITQSSEPGWQAGQVKNLVKVLLEAELDSIQVIECYAHLDFRIDMEYIKCLLFHLWKISIGPC